MTKPATGKPGFDARWESRVDVVVKAVLRETGGNFRFAVDVLDLSLSGYRFETSCVFGIGTRVFLTLPSFEPLASSIAWRSGRDYGARFDKPLHPAVRDLIAARFPKLTISD